MKVKITCTCCDDEFTYDLLSYPPGVEPWECADVSILERDLQGQYREGDIYDLSNYLCYHCWCDEQGIVDASFDIVDDDDELRDFSPEQKQGEK